MCGFTVYTGSDKMLKLSVAHDFKKVNYRGPDNSHTEDYGENGWMGFHRLKIIDVSNNRITKLYDNFISFFLNNLSLSGNSIEVLPTLILPSLEELYLDRNKIENEGTKVIYLPNLKVLNLDFNKISGFCPVWSLLRHSKKL